MSVSGESQLEISSIKLRLVEDGRDGLIAWASCLVNNGILLNNIAIRRGRDGDLFLTYPAKRTMRGEKYNYFNPINAEAAKAIQEAVFTRLATLARASAAAAEEGAQTS